MSETLLKIKNINKKYGRYYANKNISLEIVNGEIYGLIGKNGAGKSTLMKIIGGMVQKDSGYIEIFGESDKRKIDIMKKNIGFLIERPSIDLSLSAEENIKLHSILKQEKVENINELLKIVGLNDIGNKKVAKFSIGMKQRLGIAIALIGNPRLLILDEPVSGLDPIGIREIRELMLYLCKEKGITILLSSHNLSELYQVATEYIILNDGKINKKISHEELDKEVHDCIVIRLENLDEVDSAINILKNKFNISRYKIEKNNSIKFFDFKDNSKKIFLELEKNKISISEFYIEKADIESYLIKFIEGDNNG